MDHRRFDLLTRMVGESQSRRRLILGALGAVVRLSRIANDELTQARGKHGHHKKCRAQKRGKTCAGAQCGPVTNNCHRKVNCGDWPAGQSCNAGRCQTSCMPTTCAEQGLVCGTANDQCGNTLQCGDCPNGFDCQSGACTGTGVVLGNSCTSDGACCSGTCGTLGSANGICCTPDQQVAAGGSTCCNGNFSTYNQGGTVYCGTPACTNDNVCASNDPCVVDRCDQGQCVHTPVPGCCTAESQCNDSNDCTVDTCMIDHSCVHTDQPNNTACGSPARTCCQGQCCAVGTRCSNGQCVPAGGCFIAGTRIAMADGTSQPIELVEPGDQVLGRDGQPNEVIDLLRPVLGERPLYSLNGDPAFVTAGHPFLTEDGWKAVDPIAAWEETPGLPIGQLGVGDALLSLAGVAVTVGGGADHHGSDIQIAPWVISRIDREAADPSTPLFNLRVAGDHTYFANDLLVHNKIFRKPPRRRRPPRGAVNAKNDLAAPVSGEASAGSPPRLVDIW